MLHSIKRAIFQLGSGSAEKLILEVFQYQAVNVLVYKQWIEYLGVNVQEIKTVSQIPFLPVKLFSSHKLSDGGEVQRVFKSSGTSGSGRSRHFLTDVELYQQTFHAGFKHFGHAFLELQLHV